MPGRLLEWPSWPEFEFVTAEKDPDLTDIKRSIVAEYGEAAIRQSWLRVCQELERVTDELEEKGTQVIPQIEFDQLFNLSIEEKQRIKEIGCFVVRNTVPAAEATGWYRDLKDYVGKNREKVTGWPKATPFVLNMYFSPTQVAARSHPNQLRVAKELNSWWNDSTSTTSEPLSYADAVRIRPPSAPMLGLGPHIDAGSLSRWGDPTYRSVYTAVFSGHPENYDLYDLTKRQYAKQAFYPGPAHSRVLRAFQGWTALTSAAPGEGSLMLLPAAKWAIAYVMLRPFFSPLEDDVLDASKWKFDPTTPFFPGTFRTQSQHLSRKSHPHLRLETSLVSIPAMQPGDTVWWHADCVHAVEAEHNGSGDACVVYIAATPSTAQNKDYIKSQLADFLEGQVPEDFRSSRDMSQRSTEGSFEDYTGHQGIMSEEGRRAMGFGL